MSVNVPPTSTPITRVISGNSSSDASRAEGGEVIFIVTLSASFACDAEQEISVPAGNQLLIAGPIDRSLGCNDQNAAAGIYAQHPGDVRVLRSNQGAGDAGNTGITDLDRSISGKASCKGLHRFERRLIGNAHEEV